MLNKRLENPIGLSNIVKLQNVLSETIRNPGSVIYENWEIKVIHSECCKSQCNMKCERYEKSDNTFNEPTTGSYF